VKSAVALPFYFVLFTFSVVPFPFTFVLFLPGSQHFAAVGEIELAYHPIRPAPAELRDTEQQGDGKAEYGVRLLEHLSEDLQCKLGRGFSISNLRNMRRFYLDNRIHQAPGELN